MHIHHSQRVIKKIKCKKMPEKKPITSKHYDEFAQKAGAPFDQYYAKNYNKLFNWMCKYVNDSDMAHDLTNEAFVKALENIEKYSNTYQFNTWLYTITKNLARDQFKRNKVVRFVSMDTNIANGHNTDSKMTLADTLAYDVDDQESEYTKTEQKAQILKEMIDQLDGKYREILTMREINQMSYEDIYLELGLNPSTAKSRIRQGRLKLSKMAAQRFAQIDMLDDRTDYNWTY